MPDEEKTPWQVVAKAPEDQDAAELSQKVLDALWKDPEFREDFWGRYRARVTQALRNGEL